MRRGLWLPAVGWATLAFLYVPIAVLVVFSFDASRYGVSWDGFTWRWYSVLLHDRKILSSTWNSLFVAVVSSLLSTALATLAVVGRGRADSARRRLKDACFAVPLLVPELMLAVGFLLFFSMLRADLGLWALVVAHAT
ncbi:MAG: hypothetical protein KGL53_16790, partial [Elusimicrobia bacterium]|nr:hypothetical protein [Elusimicrobiota bacterium]